VDTQPEICLNAYDGQLELTITGGTPFVDAITSTSYFETRIEGAGFVLPDPMDINQGYTRNDNLIFENLQGGESYRIYVRDFNGCTDERVVNIGLGVDLASQAIVQYGCEGIFPNSTVTIEMTDESLLPDLLFSLDIDDMTRATTINTFGDLTPGIHTVYIYHSNGCMDEVSFTLDEFLPLSLTVSKTGPDEITAVASGGYGNYLYSFQDQVASSENIFKVAMDANVVVKVTDDKGCVAMVVLPFNFDTMVEFPNFFTPNGDNKNDKWSPINREFFPFIEVIIYDRYGRVVAILDQIRAWDGTYEGNAVPTGDYWYVVNANDRDKQRYVGHFTLYR
jgi:gliding motility-associated-like protein